MTKLNIGARNAKTYRFDVEQAVGDAKPVFDRYTETHVPHEIASAMEWCDDRGNVGDGVDYRALGRLQAAVADGRGHMAVRHALELLSGRMHPTARDIVGSPARTVVYQQTGLRAHTYETEQ